MEDKLKFAFLPALWLYVGLMGGYTFFHWLLVIQLDWLPLKEVVLHFWAPIGLTGLMVLLMIRPVTNYYNQYKSEIMKFIYPILFCVLGVVTSCSNSSQPNDPIPEHETLTIKSKKVGEDRIINVWTPDDYKTSSDTLPVIYMADGGIKEDFPHIANTLAKLIKEQKIKPLILVGIENTQRRRDLTGFTEVAKDKEIAPVVGGSEAFRAFISEELFPEIDKRYRTTNEKSIIGESASGLFVMETFFLTPEMFDNYIAFDPSLWWNNHYLVRTAKEHLAKFPTSEKRVWFAGSNTDDIAPFTKELAEIFKTENLPNLQWIYSDEPEEEHATIFRATKEKAISWTLNRTEKGR